MKILINNYEYYNILVIYMSQILIPENVIVKRKGRPPNPNSSRQQKLASTEPLPVKKLGRPKKVIEPVEEPKPVKKSRGRPVVEGSLRQQKKSEEKRPKGRPKKTETTEPKPEPTEPKSEPKKGRPSKCDSVPEKSNVKNTETFNRPIIEWLDIDKKFKLNSLQHVNPLLLNYSKINKDLFFDIIETLLQNRLSGKVKRDISKTATKNDLYIIFRKICSFAVYYGFTTAYEIENALILRIVGDLQDKPAELKRFMSFLKKNCIGKQGKVVVKAKTATKPKKDKVYTPQELTNFYDVPIDKKLNESSLSFGDILANNFSGINKSIRLNENEKIEILDWDMDEEGEELTTKSWRTVNSNKMVLKGVARRILDALKEANEGTYEELNKLYKEEPEYVFENLTDYIA
jgi:hypothetical protein